jgi:hypothetical protein
MDIDDFWVPGWSPFSTGVAEIANELLFLRIHGDDRLAAPSKGGDFPVDDSKLLVSMRVLPPFKLLAPTLKEEMEALQLAMDGFPANFMSQASQFVPKMSNTLRGPENARLRVACHAPAQRLF